MSGTGWFTLIVVLSAATYRAGRFIRLDTIINAQREWTYKRLEGGGKAAEKLLELLKCPYCITVWFAAVFTLAVDWFSSVPVPIPVFTGAAVAAGSLCFWNYVDFEDETKVKIEDLR